MCPTLTQLYFCFNLLLIFLFNCLHIFPFFNYLWKILKDKFFRFVFVFIRFFPISSPYITISQFAYLLFFQSALPPFYAIPSSADAPLAPSLDQLRLHQSATSVPPPTSSTFFLPSVAPFVPQFNSQQQQQQFIHHHQPQFGQFPNLCPLSIFTQFSSAAAFSHSSFPGPPILPNESASSLAFSPSSSAHYIPQHYQPQPPQHPIQSPSANAIINSANQSPSPPMMAQMLQPNLSAITPEMAATLLSQLQQHNPALFQTFVQQHSSSQSASSPTSYFAQSPPPPNHPPSSSNQISSTAPSAAVEFSSSNGTSSAAPQMGPVPLPNPLLPAPPRANSTMAIGARRNNNGQKKGSTGANKTTTKSNTQQNGQQETTTTMAMRQNSNGEDEANPNGVGGGGGGGEQPIWVMR
jgi:hypothetical protein